MKKWFYPLGLVTLLGFAALFLTFTRDEMIKFDPKMAELLGDNAFITVFHYLGETKFIVIVSLCLLAYLWIRSNNYRGMLFVLLQLESECHEPVIKEMGTARTSRRTTSIREALVSHQDMRWSGYFIFLRLLIF